MICFITGSFKKKKKKKLMKHQHSIKVKFNQTDLLSESIWVRLIVVSFQAVKLVN